MLFNSAGNHVTTVRRLGDSTHFRTGSRAVAPRLDSILTLSGQAYRFVYNGSNRLTSVTAPPAAGTTRTTTIAIGGGGTGTITSITDPDAKVVGFGYHATFTRRMITRTDRRSTTTTFSYDNGWKVSQSSLAMGATPNIVDGFAPAETRGLVATSGLSTLVDTALATRGTMAREARSPIPRGSFSTSVSAPRSASSTGSATPRGSRATIQRSGAGHTRAARQRARAARPSYTARGNVHILMDSGGIVAGQRDSTRYEWNETFDVVERIVPQLGDSITRTIDGATGNVLSQQDRRGSGSEVQFRYYGGGAARSAAAISYPGADRRFVRLQRPRQSPLYPHAARHTSRWSSAIIWAATR